MRGISTFRVSLAATTRGDKTPGEGAQSPRTQEYGAARLGHAAPVRVCAVAVLAALTLAGPAAVPAFAQSRSIAVANPLADKDRLAIAQKRMEADPADVVSMRDAADASIRLGALDDALDYLNRADMVRPGEPPTRALRGSVMVLTGKPRVALALFDEAESGGIDPASLASDRGLAHDLLGDQQSAQFYYAIANAEGPSPEVTMRYAFSLAVSGKTAAAEEMLRPLLTQDDPSAWRIRAFILAVSGRGGEAVAMLYGVVPRPLAESLAPYIRSVASLTPAQQVAAAHLGIFPKLSAMGRAPALGG